MSEVLKNESGQFIGRVSNAIETQGAYVDNEGVYHRGQFRITVRQATYHNRVAQVRVWANTPGGHKDKVVYNWESKDVLHDSMTVWDEAERAMESYGLRPRDITCH